MSELIDALNVLPKEWAKTPVLGNKIPYLKDWQKTPASIETIAQEIESGKAQGFGILTGKLSGGIMAIDCDGHNPHALFKEILGGDIPLTVAFTSGKDGRAQYLFYISEEYWASIKTKKVGNAKDGGMLEFRWDGCQSVLPPSVHPETGSYKWIDSPDTTTIAPLPDAVLEYLLKPKQHPKQLPSQPKPKPVFTTGYIPPIPLERCLSKEHRAALENGVSEGNRDDMGCSLARDLIGVASYVPSIQFDYKFSLYQLPVDGVHDKPQYSQFDSNITDGLFKNNVKIDPETDEFKLVRERIGNHLEAIAYVNNPNGDGASIHIEFKTIRHKTKRWTMPRGAIVCETSQMLAELQNRGYFFDISKKKQLVEYLNALGGDVATTYTITDTTGWIDGAYVTQNKTYSLNGDSDLKFRDVEPIADSISEIKGTLAEWQDKIGSLCASNSRLIFALGTGLAAPLQPLVDVESGGFHVVGTTSVGKTTMLRVGSSAVGIKNIPHWRTTTNGLESIACAHNHMLLPLDEIGQAEPREVGAIAYMLANGQGKTRMTKNLTNRKPKTWQLLFLSSGELGMGAYMAQSGIALKGGQEVRLPDIPAVPSGSPFGVFESIHNFESAKQFAEHLDRATQTYHGTLLDAFLPKLVTDKATNPAFASTLKKQVYAIARKLSEGTIDTAVARVANRFALVQVALELAHAYGLLPFPLEHIGWAIGKMFRDWLDYRGGDGSIEVKNACDRIRNLFVTQEYGDRIYNLSDGDAQSVRNLLAYRKTNEDGETEEFWVPTSVFDLEICTGVDKPALIKELQKRGWLAPPRNDGKSTLQRRIKKRRNYYYVFQPQNIFGENSSESGESGELVVYNSLPIISTAPDILTHQHKSSSESGESVKEVVNGSDSLDSPRLTEAVSQNGNSQMLSKQPSQPSDSPVSPDSPAKVQSQKIVDGYLSPPLNKGDKVIVQTSQAVGVVIDRRIKNHRSPKKGVFPVSQYLIEFEEGNRTWLDGDVLVLDE